MMRGEPGVGKSTLVDAFLAGSGALAGVGQCLGHRGPGEPYMPVLEALGELARGPAGRDGRRRARAARADLARRAAVAARRAARRRGGPPPRAGRDARADAARDARGARRDRRRRRRSCSCSRTCTGPTTRRSTCSPRCCAAAIPARLLVLGTYRPVAGDGAPPVAALVNDLSVRGLVDELPVTRLPADAVAAYLEARFPAAPAARGAGRAVLAQRTGGNPLFMRNLLDHWLWQGALAERGGAVELTRPRATLEAGIPPTLRAHIRDQLDRLSPEDAEMLSAASVAGRDFSTDTLAAALDRDREAVEARCAELAQRTRLIESRDGGHAFPHDLHREVLYELLPADARARLHARVGAHLADALRPGRRRHGGRARLPLHGGPRPRARGAVPAAGGGARVRPQRARGGDPPPARRARGGVRTGGRHRAHALGGRAALLARPGARGDRRLVGGRGRGGAAARAQPRRAGCRTTSRSSPCCSRSRRCTSCAASSRAPTTWP